MTNLREGIDFTVKHSSSRHEITHAAHKELVFVAYNGEYESGNALVRFEKAAREYIAKLDELEKSFGVKFGFGDNQLFLTDFGDDLAVSLYDGEIRVINEEGAEKLLAFLDEAEELLLKASYKFSSLEAVLHEEGFELHKQQDKGILQVSHPILTDSRIEEYEISKGRITLIADSDIERVNNLRRLVAEAKKQRNSAFGDLKEFEAQYKGGEVLPENPISVQILSNAQIKLYGNAKNFLQGEKFIEENGHVKYAGPNTGYVARALTDCGLIDLSLRNKGIYALDGFAQQLALHELGAEVPQKKYINSVLQGQVSASSFGKFLPNSEKHLTHKLDELIEQAANHNKRKTKDTHSTVKEAPSTKVSSAKASKPRVDHAIELKELVSEIRNIVLNAVIENGGNKHAYKGFIKGTVEHSNEMRGARVNTLLPAYLKDFSGEKAEPVMIASKVKYGLRSLVNVLYKAKAKEDHPDAQKLTELVDKHNNVLSRFERQQKAAASR